MAPASNASFDHHVGAGDEGGRDFEAKRLHGREIDGELELWRLHGKVARLFAIQDTMNVGPGLSEQIDRAEPIGEQPATPGEQREWVNGRQAVTRGERDDEVMLRKVDWGRQHDETAMKIRPSTCRPLAVSNAT